MNPSKQKIFILDDEINFIEDTKRLLEEASYTVAGCAKPAESLRAMKKFQPDCLILDLRMPLFDGQTFLPWIRRQFPNLAVVVCTGMAEFDKQPLTRLGVRCYLMKPFTAEVLFDTIDRAILEQSLSLKQKTA